MDAVLSQPLPPPPPATAAYMAAVAAEAAELAGPRRILLVAPNAHSATGNATTSERIAAILRNEGAGAEAGGGAEVKEGDADAEGVEHYVVKADATEIPTDGGSAVVDWVRGFEVDMVVVLHATKCAALLDDPQFGAGDQVTLPRPHQPTTHRPTTNPYSSPPTHEPAILPSSPFSPPHQPDHPHQPQSTRTPVVLILGGTDVNIDAHRSGLARDEFKSRVDRCQAVVAFSESMLEAAPARSFHNVKTFVIPQVS